ncbi:hypothetical protein EON65_26240 [archaeon]|nr:MAG: hypothetical protein EON65_26240 [archaeon]
MRKQRISSLAYVRSTIRFYLSVWRDRVATHERARVLTGRAAKYYKNKAFWSILRRLRQLTALRWKRRRQCELACIHVYIRRYYRHIQKVLQQKYSLERAQQRYEVSSTWGSWQRWRRRTARHEQLRRLYNIYRFKQLAKGTFSGVGARSTVWSRGVTGLSLFDQVDKDQAEIQRRTLLVQVFYAWKLRFVPMQRKEKSLFGTVMFKHFAYLCRRVLLRWHAVYEDVSVVRGKLHNAICKWWDCLVARRNQRKLLVRHGVVYTNRLKVHRLLYRWRNRVMSHYKCMRSASLQKHYVLREFSSMQHAVHTIQCTRNFYVRKTFLHIWYAVYRERQNNLRPFVTRIALRHMWREWVARYNDAVMYASLSLSHAQQPKRKLIDLKSTPVVDKENSRENKQRSLLLKRQVDFSYTTIHPTSIHDDLYIVSAVSSSHAVLPQPRTVDKEALARGYVKQFEKRKQSSRKECSFSGMSFVS